MKQNNSAFTLVELIVVITILAVLATVAFISFQWYTAESKNTTNLTNLKIIDNSRWYFHIKNNFYPEVTDWFNITSSWTTYATQWYMWKKTLGLLWVSQDTQDINTWEYFFYTLGLNKQKYGLVWFQTSQTSYLNDVYANDYQSKYIWNWAPVIIWDDNQNITQDIDVLNVPETFKVKFDDEKYWDDSNKLLKYYYHPNAISVVNFNDDKFEDILWNLTTVNKKPNITKWKVWNGMLINWDWGGLQVHINPDKFTDKLTMSAWVKQKSYNLEDTYDIASGCWDNWIIMRFWNNWWAYMVSDYQWTLCWYHHRYSPRWYHSSDYTIQLDIWTHVVQVWNWQDLKFYVNGNQVWNTITSQYVENYDDIYNTSDFYLIWIEAMDDYVWWLTRYFDGIIDEVSMYNTDLSAAEVAEVYDITK